MTEGQIDETMGPELISPLVAYLCHASCEITGQAYSVGGGRVSRLFLGHDHRHHRTRPDAPR